MHELVDFTDLAFPEKQNYVSVHIITKISAAFQQYRSLDATLSFIHIALFHYTIHF